MKYLIFILLFSMSTLIQASNPLRIGVITDLHYLSEKLMTEGKTLDKYTMVNGRTIQYTPAILDKVLNDYTTSHIDILLITGDLTKDGEYQSHLDLTAKLNILRNKGIKIYVIPGNHDINMPNAIGFSADSTYKVKNVSPRQFAEIYSNYGYSSALQRDSESLSYVSALDDKTWLLAIDAAKYNEYTNSSITSGRILPSTEKWILNILTDAKQKHIRVLGMMHWGLVEHLPYQSAFFPKYLVDDWQHLANLFADNGLEVIFTGHFHTNDITSYTSESDNVIYDIETGALTSYPYAYRFIDYYPDRMDITTKNISAIAQNPYLAEESKLQMRDLSERLALSMLRRQGMDSSEVTTQLMAKAMSEIFIIHAFGDEQISDELRVSLRLLSTQMEVPLDINELELDFPPADNNLTIQFKN